MSDEERALARVVLDRRRVLRAGGLVGLAVASAGLLTACPVVGDESGDDEDESGDDSGDGSGDDGSGGDDDSDDD